ncbi:MAG: hypothetical protein NZL93_05690 [Chthoniobacterales bacterium]|nr:hypothetical protein [Chthoniobacterales bacterium]
MTNPNPSRSTSEKGLGQLLEKSRQLHEYLLTLTDYNPGQPELEPANYKSFLDQVAAANQAVDASLAELRIARDQRAQLYHSDDGLIKRAARIRDYVASLPGGKNSAAYRRIQAICQKMRPGGLTRLAPEPDPNSKITPEKKKKISQYEVSFGSILARGRELEQILLTLPGYNPPTSDLTPTALDALLDAIELKNAEVAAKLAIANQKISLREKLYSTDPTGLRGLNSRIKLAVASQYGKKSPQYTNLTELKV